MLSHFKDISLIELWSDIIYIEFKIHVFVWIQVLGFILSYRSHVAIVTSPI